MNLVLDIGNSRVKYAVYDPSGSLAETFVTDRPEVATLDRIGEKYPDLTGSILSSTRTGTQETEAWLSARTGRFIRFSAETPVPVKNGYATPHTLGLDRLAAAVGAAVRFPGEECLVVDLGTAITVDRLTGEGTFLGGNISPGVGMRFRSLHEYTDRLPLMELTDADTGWGTSTSEALVAGVVRGIAYEIEGYVREVLRENGKVRIIFTGGDGIFFAKRVKYPIFVWPEMILDGLNAVIAYNERL